MLGAHGRYDDMVTEGWTLLFDWRLEEHWFWGDDQSQGVIDFFGTVSYEVADGDLLVHLIQSEAVPTVIPIDDAGNTRTMNLLEWILGTETILRIEDYQEGDLGINFYDLGEGCPSTWATARGCTIPAGTPASTMTNNGQFIAPLEERPATPERPDDSEAGAQPPPVITGGGGNDEIAAIEASHVEAGAGDDKVTGSPGADVLDGGTGADRLEGGAADSYVVDDLGDAVLEQGGGGIDSVAASVDFTLGANVEHLSLTGTAVLGRGNELANRLFGNDGANVLEGLAGDDTLYGGAGADAMHGGEARMAMSMPSATATTRSPTAAARRDRYARADRRDRAGRRGGPPPRCHAGRCRAHVRAGRPRRADGVHGLPRRRHRRRRLRRRHGLVAPSCSRKRTPPRCSTTSRRRRSTIPTSSPSGRRRSSRPRRCSPTIATSRVTR